jgi:hypothetical protein
MANPFLSANSSPCLAMQVLRMIVVMAPQLRHQSAQQQGVDFGYDNLVM